MYSIAGISRNTFLLNYVTGGSVFPGDIRYPSVMWFCACFNKDAGH